MSISKRGDTIVEVMMALAIFAILAVITINLMNGGINNAQRTLEITMARNEIDSQAEALRYIHQSYIAERQLDKESSQFRKLWDALRAVARDPKQLEDTDTGGKVVFDINRLNSCSQAYSTNGMVQRYNAFVLNTRLILPDSHTRYEGEDYTSLMKSIVVGIKSLTNEGNLRLVETPLYPRIIYNTSNVKRSVNNGGSVAVGDNSSSTLAETQIFNRVNRAEGVFIIAVGDKENDTINSNYFDFYIRTCWHSVGSIAPSTITTIVRLYNPEVIE